LSEGDSLILFPSEHSLLFSKRTGLWSFQFILWKIPQLLANWLQPSVTADTRSLQCTSPMPGPLQSLLVLPWLLLQRSHAMVEVELRLATPGSGSGSDGARSTGLE
jgi:hypothetical protein